MQHGDKGSEKKSNNCKKLRLSLIYSQILPNFCAIATRKCHKSPQKLRLNRKNWHFSTSKSRILVIVIATKPLTFGRTCSRSAESMRASLCIRLLAAFASIWQGLRKVLASQSKPFELANTLPSPCLHLGKSMGKPCPYTGIPKHQPYFRLLLACLQAYSKHTHE